MQAASPSKIDHLLPRLIRRSDGSFIQPCKEPTAFVHHQLDVSRLDRIARHLWLAGRVGNVHSLHRQHLLGRQVIVTEQSDLHLLWINDTIFIKPLPGWLLDEDICKQYICTSPYLQASANGLLRTYACLVAYESDFAIATNLKLLPQSITWPSWQQLVQDILLPLCLQHDMATFAPRYTYGELRLSRINLLYRFLPELKLKYLFRGYHYGSQTYQRFLESNFAWLIAGFAYIALVLTAMQVGLGTRQLQASAAFNAASAGFTVFSIVVPLFALGLQLTISLVLIIYHVRSTLVHLQQMAPKLKP
ncbi:hypothetical protein LTR41_007610 [Exophiala xenobiotica]|uniref:Uncharacterized protein n=1 Tax=Vermiconidia calcicola TaxID=1690605 RepID=A0AAV9Q7X8_9PEZI|nr:hypothetical protein LTR41_007610 [Exophiala xenobiotica]KAK5535842.1 hypothetical protein LTR25_005744 [Vermiconidia calcicola]KAK5548782.1 hypothetical protein LTR23_001271 [Chaetothyriales sp. CCFEE 6169]